MKNLDLFYVRHNIDKAASKISSSSIRYYDLTLLLRGSLHYKVNGEDIMLRSGDIILISPGDTRFRYDSSEKVDYISFNFYSKEEISLPCKMERAIGSDTLLLISAYDEFYRHAHLDNKEKNEHLLACILLMLEDRVKETRYNPLTLKIIEYIHSNLSKKITLDDIGKVTFFSPVYCDSVFKRETGRSIIDYLLEARVSEAKRLLVEASLSLTTVSELVGFDDYNYFSRVFKKRTGYTPSEYRKFSSTEY